MFVTKAKRADAQINGFIGKEVTFRGKLGFGGTMRIDGNFEGEIEAEGTLIVGDGAKIYATIKVDTAIISGEVRGDVVAATKVELRPPGRMYGNIKAPTVAIGEGVFFEGNCITGGGEKDISTSGKIRREG